MAFNIILGAGDVGQLLVESNKIDLICFTGSTVVGKKIAKICEDTLKPIILELGGKDPMIVLEDANLHRAIEAALFGGLNNAGQACISIEEVFIEKNIFNTFSNKISERIKNMIAGENNNDEIGSIITEQNYEKINESCLN